ncbi:MAG: hypothetical protein FGM14_16955 [Flavobacteriales bacterium]|nr:hypothetical protein [Flavobacteriales bacterium]
MSVQNGEVDQWHHAYQYDADNRITAAYTNSQTPLIATSQLPAALENELVYNNDWENDAKYFYYAHGPLARTEIGNDELQGYDFIYNLQGWMKGINAITTANDPGQDGFAGVNNTFAKDISAFSLEYFNNDYKAINTASPFAQVDTITSHATLNSSQLFNGNIRYMQTRLTNPNTKADMPMLNAYKYDQLNRLKESRSYETGLTSNVWNPTTYGNAYYNAFTYDAMGNIENQIRHARNGAMIDNLTYHYQKSGGKLVKNRLYHLNDDVTDSNAFDDDIDNMLTFRSDVNRLNVNNNYNYDEEGRLVKDSSERINKIVWRVDGKVKEIQRNGGSAKWLRFDYDAMGNRIAKHVFANNGSTHEKSTYYVLDAQGNQISTYDYEVVGGSAKFHLKERNIFGSSRIGSKQDSLNVLTATLSQNYTQILGKKYYEFTNHLGNVLTVFTDLKVALDENSNNVVDGYKVQVLNISDYSPFGVQLDGRTLQNDFYRFGYQGSEKDDESKGGGNSYTTFYRQLDPRVGRWFSMDPVKKSWESPYVSMENKPITFSDPNGDDVIGTSEISAERTQKIIVNDVFKNESFNDFKKLIVLDSDNKTFKKIDNKKFDEATKNLSPDEKALAMGYFKAINDDKKHYVTVYLPTDNLGSTTENQFSSGGLKSNMKASVLDPLAGGGVNTSLSANSDKTLILMNSQRFIGDAFSSINESSISNHKSSAGELLTHELIGHGLTLYNNHSDYNTWKNAIQMSNLYLRVNKIDIYRDGSHHENLQSKSKVYNQEMIERRMTKNAAFQIPEYIK